MKHSDICNNDNNNVTTSTSASLQDANPTIRPYVMPPPLISNAHRASPHVLADNVSNLPKAAR